MSDLRKVLEAWFDKQIEDAKGHQIEGFRRNQIAGERGHARHCALFEAKQAVLEAVAMDEQSRPGNAGASAVRLVDWAYLYATEGGGWPDQSTISDYLIELAERRAPTQADADMLKAGGTLKALLAADDADLPTANDVRGILGPTPPAAAAGAWTADEFWQYVGGLAGEWEAGEMRRMMNERGLALATPPAAAGREEVLAIVQAEFERQIKIIEDATNDKALTDTGRSSIRAIADACALTAQRIASNIRAASTLPPQVRGTVIDEIAAERQRHVSKEGWAPAHDDEHINGELATAAALYALTEAKRKTIVTPTSPHWRAETILSRLWPWEWEWWKPKNRRRDLIRAGSLIVAEVERLDRALALPRAELGTEGGK